MLAAVTSADQWALIAFIPLGATFGAWLVKQIINLGQANARHAEVMTALTQRLEQHETVDVTAHAEIVVIGQQVDAVRLEQVRVATQLATTNASLLEIGHASVAAANAAAAAVALAAEAAAKVVAQTATDTATVLAAAPH